MNRAKIILPVTPIIDYSVRNLCIKPYHGHKRGCPNYGKKRGCPPGAKYFDDVYDLSKTVFAIVNKFDFAGHVTRMKKLHPDWSQRQLECCLYWQPKARKQLLEIIRHFMSEHKAYQVETCPEAMGVDVTRTVANSGLILEWPPKITSCQIALAGIPKMPNKIMTVWL